MIGSIKTNPHLLVKDTGTPKGRGVFTRQDYRAGDIVETSPVLEVQSAFADLARPLQLVVYSWGYLTGDERKDVWGVALGFGSLFNHSSQPNLVYSADPDRRAIVYRATRQIDAGEELTIDYNADVDPGTGGDWFETMGVAPIG